MQWFDSIVSSETTPGRISLPPPPAPQWFACAWPIVIFTSREATSLWSHTGVPRDETPTYVYDSALRGSFWKNGIPSFSIRSRFSRPSFISMSDSDIGKTLPFAQITQAFVVPAASSASRTAGSSFDCGVGRNWLSTMIATDLPPAISCEKDGPSTGLSSACRAASVAFGTGSGSSG